MKPRSAPAQFEFHVCSKEELALEGFGRRSRASDHRAEGGAIGPQEREGALGGEEVVRLQVALNDLHEEIYRRGGVRPVNAAIDELGKLLFLQTHSQRYPSYVLQTGSVAQRSLSEVLQGEEVRESGREGVRAVRDAFAEVSTLPVYMTPGTNGYPSGLFPPGEPFRLDHPEVLAKALDILGSVYLSKPIGAESDVDTVTEVARHDLLGLAYDVFLRGRYDGSGGLGTYLTPSAVVDCMVEMAFQHVSSAQLWARRGDPEEQLRWHPAAGEENLPAFCLGDVCCGTGRFLMRALELVERRVLAEPDRSPEEKARWIRQLRRHAFVGADQSTGSITKARINFLMYGEEHPPVFAVEDSILDPRVDALAGRLDVVLTNPPFGEGKYVTPSGLAKMRDAQSGLGLGWTWKGDVRRALNRADPALLFLDRNLQLLKPGGLLFAVVPDGLLEPAYAYAHEYLLSRADLLAVVSLPKATFAISGTVAKTSFLCLRKRGDELDPPSPLVFMAVAEHVGFVKKGPVEVPDPLGNDLPRISASYSRMLRMEPFSAALLSQDADPHSNSFLVPREQVRGALTAQTYHPDRVRARVAMSGDTTASRPLGELARPVVSRAASRGPKTAYFVSVLHVDERSNVDWEAAETHDPSTKGRWCQAGDILYSCLNPAKTRVTVIPEEFKGAEVLCSSEFAVLRPVAGEDPYFVALTLRLETTLRQVLPVARGTSSSRRRVHEGDLLDVVVPYPPRLEREGTGALFREGLRLAREGSARVRQAVLDLESCTGAGQLRP